MTSLYDEHADVYDLAFDWDVREEAAWLHARLGDDCRSVLEPGCGSGRVVEALARRGLEAVGLDRSPKMIDVARKRLAASGIKHATVVLADMTAFELRRLFDGAVCPINTLLHLSPAELDRHLEAMANHLRPGSRYLVQLALYGEEDVKGPFRASKWEMARGDTTLRITWVTEEVDPRNARLRQRSRIEVVSGPQAGQVLEETHEMTAWTPESWQSAVERSPFRCTATYDGDRDDRARVAQGSTGPMLWHELTRT